MKLFGYDIIKSKPTFPQQVPRKNRFIVKSTPRPAQTRDTFLAPQYSRFNADMPFAFNLDLIDVLRSNLAIMDAVPIKYNRLVGSFRLDAFGNTAVQEILDDFHRKVQVNWYCNGWNQFQYQMIDSAIAKGAGIGETIPWRALNGVARLKTARMNDFKFVNEKGRVRLAQRAPGGYGYSTFQNEDWIYYLALDQRDGHPMGYSIFYSVPFIAQILHRIWKSIENTVWRIGDPSFLVVVTGAEEGDEQEVEDAASSVETQFIQVQKDRREGLVRDVFAGIPKGAEIKVEIIGEKGRLTGMDVNLKHASEQIIAKSGLPGWLFGFHWASRETLAKHENDMIVASVKWIREMLDPVIERIFTTHLIMSGKAGAKWEHVWNEVNLLDEVEQAKARNYNAMADEKEIANAIAMLGEGWFESEEEFNDYLIEHGLRKSKLDGTYLNNKLKEIFAQRAARKVLKYDMRLLKR